ncbi:small RNA 2'-O-methyltransferase [Cloeon dipterum]|uniref:small RNA 2'-O-methyltransferase n=1 Tax=Cloeon dipterum TaxID=197152 RepID=UPI0032204354
MLVSVPSLYILVYDACTTCFRRGGRDDMEQEQGNSSDSAFYLEEAGVKFSTPVYMQRYAAVVDALRWRGTMRKVVDMGCSEFGLFNHLKNTDNVSEVVAVDADRFLLEAFAWKVEPFSADFLRSRRHELRVRVMKGSVAQFDDCLRDCDALVCVELIEHLRPEELDAVPFVVFGQVRPRIAVFTTPNADFNELFNNPSKRLRHPDHKFEWTRAQFHDWAANIAERFPSYRAEFIGIGRGPEGTEESHGFCSQMALFYREDSSGEALKDVPPEFNYELVKEVNFPFRGEEDEEAHKAKCKAEYQIHALGADPIFDKPNGDTLIPLSVVLQSVDEYFQDTNALRECLETHGWKMASNSRGECCVRYDIAESELSDEADVDSVNASSQLAPPPFILSEAAPRAWQSEPHLDAAAAWPLARQPPPAESLMFRSVNERHSCAFFKSSFSDPIRVDDSGYPNSGSVQDMDVTLGSSDELSASNDDEEEEEEERPPPAFAPPAAIPANNHDAVNNNRDGEGNDLGPDADAEQRLPEFPRWLLQVLAADEEAADEGFESSSSEDDDDD